MNATNSFLSLDALAGRLGVPRKWLADEVRAGRIPYIAAGGRKVFDPEQVRRALLKRATGKVQGACDGD